MAIGAFFAGTLKGIGKAYLQIIIDCYSRYAWDKHHTSKLPVHH